MANSILLLRMEGPMQSWGTRSRWDPRDTGLEPTKSGVIGLIGCAMGLDRDDPELEKLDRDLLFGVRIDRPGVVSTDYQTVTGYHRTAAGDFKHSGGTAKSFAKAAGTWRKHDRFAPRLSPRCGVPGRPGQWRPNPSTSACRRSESSRLAGGFAMSQVAALPRPQGVRADPSDLRPLGRRVPGLGGGVWAEPPAKSRAKTGLPPKLEAWIESPHGEYERQDSMRLNQLRFYEFRRCKRIEIDGQSLGRDA